VHLDSAPAESRATGVLPTRLAALDGIRGLAVLSIMLFHTGATWFAGYARRALRLLPALLLVLAFLLVWSFVGGLGGQQVDELRRGLVFTLLYAANLQVAFLGELPTYGLTDHMWSLSIEEQFYLVWPLVLALLLRAQRGGALSNRRLRSILVGVLVAAAAAALWRAHLWHGPADVKRVYYGPDTRADSLLIGCALALLASLRGLPRAPVLTLLGGLFLLVQIRLDSHLGSFGYEGGYVLTALAAAAVLTGVVGAPAAGPARVLSWRPLVAVGRISYGLYLWHWPIFLILNGGRLDLPWLPLQLVRFAVTFAVATLSYALLERPALQLGSRFRPVPAPTDTSAPASPVPATS
jgi:peptidoglycan/LPS O-acetylase OafA/YrhL